MQQGRSDGVQTGTVCDVRARIAEYGDHSISDRPPFAGQVVAEAMCRLHKGGQHDRLVRQFHCAENLRNHVPVESVEHRLSMLVLLAEGWPEGRADGAVDRPRVLSYENLEIPLPALLKEGLDLFVGFEGRFLAWWTISQDCDAGGVDMRWERLI